jgi:replicative DNA helicase
MAAEHVWETPEDIFDDDPERAVKLDAVAGVMRGASTRPWPETLDALGAFVRAEREAAVALQPLTPAASLLGGVLDDVAERYERRQRTGEDAIGHSTGFPTLDRILGGLDRGRMSIMLAAPGAGKTTFSNQLAYTIAGRGAPVVYVSFENSADDLTLKQIARLAGKSASDIRRGKVAPASLQEAYQTFHAGAGQRLYYVTGTKSTTVEGVEAMLTQLRRLYPDTYPVVVVDFLQRLATSAAVAGRGAGLDDMRGRVGLISQQLRTLALDTDAHIWAISSTNRAAYDTERAKPGLASGRESGDIEFAADHVLTLAPGNSDGISMTTDPLTLSVVKNRHGETGSVGIARDRITLRMHESGATIKAAYSAEVRAGWASPA